jgi:hypothetical protein
MGAISNDYNETFVPDSIKESLKLYVEHRCEPGSFLYSILINDLYETVLHADFVNINIIPHITMYVINNVPIEIYGSKEKVLKWLKGRK